jgi:hypothetical protein
MILLTMTELGAARMDPRDRLDTASSPMAWHERARDGRSDSSTSVERLLDGFSYAERQRLRYLRQLYERGKLTEFPRQPRV